MHASIRDAFVHADNEGYASNCEAIGAADLRAELGAIHALTLVMTGRADPSVPPGDSRALADGVSGARFVERDAQHLSNIERAEEFTQAVLDFLTTPAAAQR